MDPALELADYRRRVALMYLSEPRTGQAGVDDLRRRRDELFRDHPQSALTAGQRSGFQGLSYFAYDPDAVVRTRLEPPPSRDPLEIDTGGEDGVVRYRRVGLLRLPWGDLTLFWIEGYGAGSFCPFATPRRGRRPTAPAAT